MIKKSLLILVLFILSAVQLSYGEEIFGFKMGRTEVLLEMIGLNYLPLSINIPLTKEPVPLLQPLRERDVYAHLLTHVPRFIILEASTYPLPLLGLALRAWTPGFYDKMNLWTNFNLIESITVSFFEEPWAVSLFFGNVVEFDPFGQAADGLLSPEVVSISNEVVVTNRFQKKVKFKGRAYAGLLFSYGDKHIRHNLLVPADWLEIELKLIGSLSSKEQVISWSYRMGGKINWHQDIHSYLYLGLKRDRLDKKHYNFSFIHNSMIEFEVGYDLMRDMFHKVTLVLGKKFPIRKSKLIPEINLGFTWKFNSIYQGGLEDAGDKGFAFVISPNVRF